MTEINSVLESNYPTIKNIAIPKYIAIPKKLMGFPGSSAGEESTCNAGDPSSSPRSG